MSIASQIESIQPAVYYKLASEPAFNSISIFKIREKRLDTQVAQALAGLGAPSAAVLPNVRGGSAAGLTIEVFMPRLTAPLSDTPGPVCTLQEIIHIKEQPTINLGAHGTGITAETAAIMVCQTLQLFGIGLAQSFYAGENFYHQVDAGPDAPFAMMEVVMQATMPFTALPRTVMPAAAYSGGNLTLTDQQPGGGSTVYYTTDGSFPGAANPTANEYSGPVALASGTVVCAAAWNGALQGSVVNMFTTQ